MSEDVLLGRVTHLPEMTGNFYSQQVDILSILLAAYVTTGKYMVA